jgi:hypothetical protein
MEVRVGRVSTPAAPIANERQHSSKKRPPVRSNLIQIKGLAEEMVRIVAAGGTIVLENDQCFETHDEVVDKIVKATRGRAKKAGAAHKIQTTIVVPEQSCVRRRDANRPARWPDLGKSDAGICHGILSRLPASRPR